MTVRDDWVLGSGIKAGDDAWLLEDDKKYIVVKVRGRTIKGYTEGVSANGYCKNCWTRFDCE